MEFNFLSELELDRFDRVPVVSVARYEDCNVLAILVAENEHIGRQHDVYTFLDVASGWRPLKPPGTECQVRHKSQGVEEPLL